eukprot:TRINITY_DN4630_c0_g1_i4.p1 TRINITY_DN4630_c0_g1~~TRINITY_DN4630_c0_g1_i4.p1  ORF type:complete len:173 (-),score=32.53 TRINITY_DN4630_c0_g1_i4:204-722(-)
MFCWVFVQNQIAVLKVVFVYPNYFYHSFSLIFRFQGLGSSFYRGSDGGMFVFDVSRQQTFDGLLQWRRSFLIQVGQEGNDEFPMLIIANKIDRTDRVVTTAMIQEFCKKHNLEFVECSAKDATNVNKAFTAISKKILTVTDPHQIVFVLSFFLFFFLRFPNTIHWSGEVGGG